MKLTTEVQCPKFPFLIDYNARLLSLGSCFAEHIGDKFTYYKFRITQNPFGILFHPNAILKIVERILSDKEFNTKDVFQRDGVWHSFYAHSRLSRSSKLEMIAGLNSAANALKTACETSTHILITLGTAFIYKHKPTSEFVVNCHKVPAFEFEKQLTSVEDLKLILNQLIEAFLNINSKVNIIFTVSPVRHIKDGIIQNNRSKSHLISALHNVLEERDSSNLGYFPSFEMVMDEFRDYRFYKRDLIHPNTLTVDLIWERFKSSFISEAIIGDMTKVEKLQKSLHHRSSTNSGEAYKKWKAYQSKLKNELNDSYPFMNLNTL